MFLRTGELKTKRAWLSLRPHFAECVRGVVLIHQALIFAFHIRDTEYGSIALLVFGALDRFVELAAQHNGCLEIG